ncbi:hypothetical protein BB561_006211 [Smittium simulii]|uniref:Endonuclease/exonuclease/phosphatase domain-containing protein n=1 Tax=Smittium simulii TaxID=133385 RepID=A0A2T9Y5W2_9FUNG|nr:hypothetical protein BB561_006211 [Smittium simulii]
MHKNIRQKQLKIAKKQPILTEKLTFCTYNVRGIKGCQHEFNELMRARQPTVVSVQETLLNKKSYRYKLQGYTVIESKYKEKLVLAELSDELQTELNTITECALSDTFQIQKNAVQIVQKYSYLGLIYTDITNVLQSVLMSIGTNSGKLFDMSNTRTKPIRIMANSASRLIANVIKTTAINSLWAEFVIPSINSIFFRLREQAHLKQPSSKTWMADLI